MPIISYQEKDFQQKIKKVGEYLQNGAVVAFPTETVYGLGASLFQESAIQKVFQVKGRPNDNPLIVHIYSVDQIEELTARPPAVALKLIDHFWPGPLTLVLPKTKVVPNIATAGGQTVALRMPSHPVAQQLLQAAEVPVVAPSANLSGKPSATTAQHVWDDFRDQIDYIIDGGPSQLGVESTVLDLTTSQSTLLRSGGISVEQIETVIGPINVSERDSITGTPVKSPGQKYRHYAPQANIYIIDDVASLKTFGLNQQTAESSALILINHSEIKKNVVIPDELKVYCFSDLRQLSANLYHIFRECDQLGIKQIYFQKVEESNLGRAIMDRVIRASKK